MASHSPFSLNDARYKARYGWGILLCIAGAALALRFPDLDQRFSLPPLMMHRSLLLHGLIPALLLCGLVQNAARGRPESPTYTHPDANPTPRLFCLGVCTGYAAHLAFDLFPHAWRGYALVYAPALGRLPVSASVVWLALSTLGCLYLGCRMLRHALEILLAIACIAASFGAASIADPHAAIGALFLLAIASWIAFALPRPSSTL